MTLIDGRLMPHLTRSGYFPHLVTIQVNTPTQSTSGATIGDWDDLAGHVALAGRLAPAGENELRRAGYTYAEVSHTALLAGQYTTITTQHRAVIGGVAYDIQAADDDSAGLLTRLLLRRVTT